VDVLSGEFVRGVERLRRPVIAPVLCVALLAVPATASAAGSVPLRPDPSPAGAATQSAAPRPDAASSPTRTTTTTPAAVLPAAPAAAPVVTPRVVTTTRPAAGSFRPPAAVSTRRPAARAAKAKHHAAAAAPRPRKPSRLAPLRLGVRYALAPPPVRALTNEHLPLLAAWALLVFLLASSSFLGLAYRLRRESLRV